ncbi:MAG TPA: MBL fold metallo-hydrolase [Blastocatellia bacterium]|nr:MBL fold metallo-hydrolase [Blastocatellia bacterium]
MRLILLGSGSTGNALYVESGATRVIVDCGMSGKEAAARMTDVGLDPTRLDGIVVTHEHVDHMKGVRVVSKTAGAPVFVSDVTRAHCNFGRNAAGIVWGEAIESSTPFKIGSLDFRPFTIPHDGADNFAFTVESEGVKVGMATDLGHITHLVSERFRGSDLIIIESNYDPEMLKVGPYPWSVKQRIGSTTGHLSNDETARWIRQGFDGSARYLVLAHLSRHCNHPELARLSALKALDALGSLFFQNPYDRLKIAPHDRPSEWFEL